MLRDLKTLHIVLLWLVVWRAWEERELLLKSDVTGALSIVESQVSFEANS